MNAILKEEYYSLWTEEEITKCKDFWRKHGNPHGAGRILER